jgi:hypothetical protein
VAFGYIHLGVSVVQDIVVQLVDSYKQVAVLGSSKPVGLVLSSAIAVDIVVVDIVASLGFDTAIEVVDSIDFVKDYWHMDNNWLALVLQAIAAVSVGVVVDIA